MHKTSEAIRRQNCMTQHIVTLFILNFKYPNGKQIMVAHLCGKCHNLTPLFIGLLVIYICLHEVGRCRLLNIFIESVEVYF